MAVSALARSGVLAALLIGAAPVAAQTYYVTPSGSDAASGLSPSSSWRSLAKVNSAAFAPGDTVMFAGGGVWTGSLNPHASGTSSAPITFGVVGTGQAVLEGAGASGYAGIDVEGRSNLAFSNFEIRNWHGNAQAVYLAGDRAISFSSIYAHDNDEGFHVSPSSATSGVTITGGSVVDTGHSGSGGVGINIPVGTTGVSVTGTLVDNVADSCIIDKGSGSIYDGLTIRHCGFGVAAYGTHGIYMRGPGIVLRNSDISDAHDDCVSVRFQGDVVEHNRIHNCPIGIGWFEYATAPGVVRFLRNVISNAGTGIYIDGSSTQHFAIANNTIIGAGSFGPSFEGINVDAVGGAVPGLALENNILVGAITPLIKVDAASNFVERANTLHTSLGFRGVWRGVNASSLAAFGALTGQGAGDITADPQLVSADPTTPDAHLTSSSPSINHGVADTAAATLTPSCDGSDTSYCGSAPDMGAIEFGNASAPPPGSGPPPPAPTPPPPPTPTPPPPPRPHAPSGLRVGRLSLHRALVRWTAVSGAARYVIVVAGREVWTGSATRVVISVPSGAATIAVSAVTTGGTWSTPTVTVLPHAGARARRHPRGTHAHPAHHHPRPRPT